MTDFPINKADYARLQKIIRKVLKDEPLRDDELYPVLKKEIPAILDWIDKNALRS